MIRQTLLHGEMLTYLLHKLEKHERQERRRERSCRRFIRNKGWWEMGRDTYSSERFFETFRICRETFNFIVVNAYDELLRKNLIEEPISPDCRLAITIFKLARRDYIYIVLVLAHVISHLVSRKYTVFLSTQHFMSLKQWIFVQCLQEKSI